MFKTLNTPIPILRVRDPPSIFMFLHGIYSQLMCCECHSSVGALSSTRGSQLHWGGCLYYFTPPKSSCQHIGPLLFLKQPDSHSPLYILPPSTTPSAPSWPLLFCPAPGGRSVLSPLRFCPHCCLSPCSFWPVSDLPGIFDLDPGAPVTSIYSK